MEFLSNKPLLITDTILRDAHQSQAATRMTIEDMIPALEQLDSIGYYSLECWGGATFDACMRFLNEDPWERLRTIRKYVKNTKLQMLFRGQNILGYKHYADDVVDAFCRKSIENGIDIIRIFDALNDVRNLEQAIKSTKKYGGEVEATLSYTISPIHNEVYFVKMAMEKDIPYKSESRVALEKLRKSLAKERNTSLDEALAVIDKGLRDDKRSNLETFRKEIIEQINQNIVLRYAYAEGVIANSLAGDKVINAAISLLSDQAEYKRIITSQDTARK